MKIASKNRLSLRKLFIAMMAVGPMSVLPSPVWAVLPTAASYTVTNGSATLSPSGSTVNINFSDKTILTWGTTANPTGHVGPGSVPQAVVGDGSTMTNFIVDSGDTWNFASAGSILNKVVAGTNSTNAALGGATAAAALINGQLLGSNAKVYVLANGGIIVGAGAQLNTQNLILSTLSGENDGTFITLGDLTYNGAPTVNGSITIGSITSGGSIKAVGSSVSVAGGTIGGDLILKAVTAGSAITLSSASATVIGGNLEVTTNAGLIGQGAFPVTVGTQAGVQNTTLSSGLANIKLDNDANDFERVVATTGTGGKVELRDANVVTFGASTIGGDLDVKVGGKPSTTSISTDGAVAVAGNANFVSNTSSNSTIAIANNSSVAGVVTANTAGGSVNLTLAGNVNLGLITTDTVATQMSGAAWPVLAGTATTDGVSSVTGITLGAGTASQIFNGNIAVTIASPIATANPLVTVDTIRILDGGSGYTANFAVGFAPLPAGSTATLPAATANVVGGVVTSITITNFGTGLTSFPTPTIANAPAGGTKAAVQATVKLSGVAANNAGSGYTTGLASPVTVIGGGSSTPATVTVAALTGDSITGYTLAGAGAGYTSMPSIVVTHPNLNAAAATATAVRDANNLVTSVAITNPGVGYGTTAPAVSFPAVSVANNFNVGNITANVTGTVVTSGALQSGNVTNLRGTTITTGAAITTATGNSQAAAVLTSTAGDIVFGGGTITANRVTVNATGNITLIAGNISTSGRAANVTVNDPNTLTATGNINLDTVALGIAANQTLIVNAQNASIRSTNNITLGNTNVSGNLTLRAGSLTTNGGNRNITLGRGDASDATPMVVGGLLTATTDGSGGIFDNNDSRLDVFGGLNLQTGFNNAGALIAGGAIIIDAATTPGALTPSIRMGLVNASTGTTAGGGITLAENTTLNLGNITGSSLTASSATGGVIDTGVITLPATGIASFAVTGNNNVVLDTATNVIPVIAVSGGRDNSFTAINSNVELRSTTNATGNTTVATNNTFAVSLGAVETTGNVVVNSGSYIDIVGNANITGNLTLNATGNVANASTFSSVYAGNVSINNTTGRLTAVGVSNPQLLSFATVPSMTVVGGGAPTTTPAAVTSTITNGIVTALAGIGGTGYTITPTVTLSAPNAGGVQATATATINAGGAITGYTITNNGSGYATAPIVTLVGGGSPTTAAAVTAVLGTTGQLAGNNTAVVTNNATNGGTNPYVTTNPNRVDVAGPTTTSILQSAGTLKVSGTTSISGPGNALLFRANDFANVVLNNTTGGVLVNDVNAVSVSGIAAGNIDIRSGSTGVNGTTAIVGQPIVEANPWGITLGNLNVGSMNITAGNGGTANSGTVTQLANTSIYSYGSAFFTTTNNTITIGNNGNNFGRVGLQTSAGASVNVTLVEDGTMKIGNLTGLRGTTTLTSRFGGIIEDPAADVVISNNGTLIANSASGSVLIGNTTHTAGTTTANIVTFNSTAPNGQVAVTSNNSTTVGNINANSLSVEVTGGNGNITQSGVIQVFGSASFSAGTPATAIAPASGGFITLGNNANNFGRVYLSTIGPAANITISEGGTLNLGRVTMPASSTGMFTASSINGDIVDTGLGGVRPGGIIGTTGTGVVSLSALTGNITLDDPTTDFPTTGGVVFNAKNVLLSPLGAANLYLGTVGQTAVSAGNLTVTSAIGSIYNAGPVNVSGDVAFQSGNGDILMTNASNNFGTVKFAGKIVSISEAGNLTLVTGSSATGAATFTTSGGDITIENRGGTISLASTGLFNASGSITLPKLIQVSDILTVSAAGTKDLSKLSVSSDLGNKAPQNFGTGTYLPPLP